jgi:hypothetical protein
MPSGRGANRCVPLSTVRVAIASPALHETASLRRAFRMPHKRTAHKSLVTLRLTLKTADTTADTTTASITLHAHRRACPMPSVRMSATPSLGPPAASQIPTLTATSAFTL